MHEAGRVKLHYRIYTGYQKIWRITISIIISIANMFIYLWCKALVAVFHNISATKFSPSF